MSRILFIGLCFEATNPLDREQRTDQKATCRNVPQRAQNSIYSNASMEDHVIVA